METDVEDPISTSPEDLQSQLEDVESHLSQLQSLIISETEKLHRYKVTNVQRLNKPTMPQTMNSNVINPISFECRLRT